MTSTDLYLGLAGFCLASSITPGPNNLMLLASGVNFGMRRSLPHLCGVTVGFAAMLLIVGFGLGRVLEARPGLQLAMKIVATLYMIWLAWRIARSGPVADAGPSNRRPIAFWQAVLFQWVNPKAWAMAVSANALYRFPDATLPGFLIVAFVFSVINLPCIGLWTGGGTVLRRWLRDPARLRIFNIAMAIVLLASFLPVVLAGY